GSTKRIALVEQGKSVEKRVCPKSKTGKCINCLPFCNITTGFSGAGAFSDGKLSLSYEVGGDLPELIGATLAQQMIDYTDKIYLEFGADSKIEGISATEKIKEIRRKAINADLKLVDCPIRHLGTEKAQVLYGKIEEFLVESGVEVFYNTTCLDLVIVNKVAQGVIIVDEKTGKQSSIDATDVVVATGRKGADWLEGMCRVHEIERSAGTVDIGVRVECRNEIMEEVNDALYESKLIGYVEPFRDKVRTFCQNPGGFVSQENYDNNLAVVNGHSYKDRKSPNTNLSILSSHRFSYPFDRPIDYAKKVGELTNMLGDGRILVQRYGDILNGKRTWQKELERGNVKPTLTDAVAGDITAAMPYRTMTNIINFIKAVDKVVPGFAGEETLLYSPEIKFYSNKVKMDEHFSTNIANFYALGDSCGWTHGLMMASVMGVMMAHNLIK
ncbi:MAG: FAD-dependent oxidoreductase, partial [Clostridia bacterium]